MTNQHIPVFLQEALDALQITPGGFYLDGTFGRGGHSRAILEALDSDAQLLAIDRDPSAIAVAKELVAQDSRFKIWAGNFSDMDKAIEQCMSFNGCDGILLDLGVSSCQIDDPERGFSFRFDGPLDMRMDNTQGQSAAQWLAEASYEEMVDVFWRYGEERKSRQVARAILRAREEGSIETTGKLVSIIESVMPPKYKLKKHPSTRVFQAIRIHINQELASVELALKKASALLKEGGRLVVISFHSLEDRIVKQYFRGLTQEKEMPRGLPIPNESTVQFKLPIKKIKPTKAEEERNPRARSAVMRILEKKYDKE